MLPRHCSRVMENAVVFGAICTKSFIVNSRTRKSTARVGNNGAQGNAPTFMSWTAAGEQVQIRISTSSTARNIRQSKEGSNQSTCHIHEKRTSAILHTLAVVQSQAFESTSGIFRLSEWRRDLVSCRTCTKVGSRFGRTSPCQRRH
jgi:hypothetical protein